MSQFLLVMLTPFLYYCVSLLHPSFVIHVSWVIRMETSVKQIVDYWSSIQDECGLAVDWSEAHELCWRCGYKCALQRCHIIPRALNGSDQADNLVLLCLRCHREAPNVDDPAFMWQWLRAHAEPFYDTYWTIRGLKEFELVFGRKAFGQIEGKKIPSDMLVSVVGDLLRDHMKRTSIHFGEGRLNPATIAWLIAQIERGIPDSLLVDDR